jgi:MFS family permease
VPSLTRAGSASARVPYALIGLLSAALTINYVDRGTLSTAAPLIQTELHLSSGQLGALLSAFFWTYVVAQPVMGALADRLGAARVLAAGFSLWSLATICTGLSGGIVSLVGLRMLMGVGESVIYPSALALLSQRVTDEHRARATGVLQLGGLLGPALGTFAGGLIMIRYGWRAMFIALGVTSLLWLIPWSGELRRADRARAASSMPGAPALREILRQRALWASMVGNFCGNYAFYFVFTWLPSYLVHERGFSLLAMTHLTTAIYVLDGASVLATGWLLDAWVRRGASVNLAYKSALALGAGGVGVCLLTASGAGATTMAALLLVMGVMDGVLNPAVCSVAQHFAGPTASGRWMGLQNAVANIAGVSAPWVTGQLVDVTGHYAAGMWLAGCIALCGLIGWVVLVPAVRPIPWQLSRESSVRGADRAPDPAPR